MDRFYVIMLYKKGGLFMDINFESYKVFYHVAQNKSITAAAKVLFVTQPTVTHVIQTLEKNLGCQLFVRSKKGVCLTSEGELLFRHISTAFTEIAEAEKDISLRKDFQQGKVTIGASETTFHHFLFSYLKEYKHLFPKIRLKVHNYNTYDLLDTIHKEKLDFGILVCPKNFQSKDLIIRPLTSFSDRIVAGSEYEFLSKRVLSLKELSTYPLIVMGKGNITHQILLDFFKKHNVMLLPDIELATPDLIVPAVLNGLGIGLVPEFFATEYIESKQIFELHIKEQMEKRDICLVYKKNQIHSIAAKEFIHLFERDLK